MRVQCPHCQSKAIITHSEKLSPTITRYYIICPAPHCGARSSMRMIHESTLTPPESMLLNSLAEQLAQLPDRERRQLLSPYQSELPLFNS